MRVYLRAGEDGVTPLQGKKARASTYLRKSYGVRAKLRQSWKFVTELSQLSTSVVNQRNHDKVLWQNRVMLARMASALLVQTKGLGLALVAAR